MSNKLAVILASGDPKVLEMGLIYAGNVVKRNWMQEMKLYLVGPSEIAVATDPALKEMVKKIIVEGTIPGACKLCSDKYGVTDALVEIGCEVEYIGDPLSAAIRDGYSVMTW
jgi:hypothetical protein